MRGPGANPAWVDLLAASVLQRRALQGELLILGGDPGIADEHIEAVLLRIGAANNITLDDRLTYPSPFASLYATM